MCVFSLDDGMVVESWYAWLAFRIRVSMSAIGSVIVMGVVPLSPRFLTRSRAGLSAIGGARLVRCWNGPAAGSRAEPARRGGQRGPSPAGLADARQLAGVRHLPQADPAQAELAEDRVRATAPLAPGVAADRELRLAGRLVDQRLLGHVGVSSPGSAGGGDDGLAGERETQQAEELATLLVVRGGGDQRDVHAARTVDLVHVDLAEHRLLGQAERVVAVTVELLGVEAAEVTDPGQGQRQQPVQELPHSVAAEGDLRADRHALAQLELGDRLAGPHDGRLLAGDGGEVPDGAVHQLGVAGGLADPHVDHDLGQPRDLHDVGVAELLLQRRRDLLAVPGEHAGQLSGGCAHVCQRSLPVRRETRMLRPSSSLRVPTRVGVPSESTTITLLTWMGASCVTIPPCWAPRWEVLMRVCFLTRPTPSTSTFCVCG